MKTELKKQLKAGIRDVLARKVKSFKLDFATPFMAREALEKHGVRNIEFESNGWDYDWWLTFRFNDSRWVAFGNGYRGWFQLCEDKE